MDSALECDVAYLGQYSPYKAPGLKDYLLSYAKEYRHLIYGPGWPNGIAVDTSLPDSLRNKLFKSATVVPCIHEPHARLYGVEVTERLFKVPLAGGFTISDPVECIHREGYFSPDEILVAESPAGMQELVRHFVTDPQERLPFIARARERVFREHTYFHRLEQLSRAMGWPVQADEVRSHIDLAVRTGHWGGGVQ